jgi:hypothetical protein
MSLEDADYKLLHFFHLINPRMCLSLSPLTSPAKWVLEDAAAVGDSAMEQLEVQLTPRSPAIRRHLARRRRRRG